VARAGGVQPLGLRRLAGVARFDARGGSQDANPVSGDVAAGGRLGWTHPVVEVGASTLLAWDHGSTSRQEVGGDLRLSPLRWLDVLASGSYALDRSQLAEALRQRRRPRLPARSR